MKAVFLDRDGTINAELPNYLTDIRELHIFDFAYEAIQLLNQNHFKTIVVTNQACVGKGLLTETELLKIHEKMQHLLSQKNAHVDSIYYCPHHPEDQCYCRKPNPGMLKRAAKDFGIDLQKSYFIGDRLFDIHTAKNAGCKTILVLTGAGKKTLALLKNYHEHPDHIASNVLDAVRWIISSPQ